jgi:hypothetical protein
MFVLPDNQDWLICVEMLAAALAHQHAFTFTDYTHPLLNGGIPHGGTLTM